MDAFAFKGYCKPIELPRKNATSAQIYSAVVSAFSGEHPMENWRLLFRQGLGPGSDGILRLFSSKSSKSLTSADIEQ